MSRNNLATLVSMKSSICRLENKIKQLKRNHHMTILEINAFFNTLITKLDIWSQDASVLLQGDAELYSDYPPLKDEIWHYLITPTEHDATTQEVLEVLCHAFSMLLSQLAQDHLPSGTHYNPSAHLINKTKSVLKTNAVSERDFGKLDCLLRESQMPAPCH